MWWSLPVVCGAVPANPPSAGDAERRFPPRRLGGSRGSSTGAGRASAAPAVGDGCVAVGDLAVGVRLEPAGDRAARPADGGDPAGGAGGDGGRPGRPGGGDGSVRRHGRAAAADRSGRDQPLSGRRRPGRLASAPRGGGPAMIERITIRNFKSLGDVDGRPRADHRPHRPQRRRQVQLPPRGPIPAELPPPRRSVAADGGRAGGHDSTRSAEPAPLSVQAAFRLPGFRRPVSLSK